MWWLLIIGMLLLTGCSDELYILNSQVSSNDVSCPTNAYCEIPTNTFSNLLVNISDVNNVPYRVRYE